MLFSTTSKIENRIFYSNNCWRLLQQKQFRNSTFIKLSIEIHNTRYEYRLIVNASIASYKKNFDNREERQAYDCSTCDQQSYLGESY